MPDVRIYICSGNRGKLRDFSAAAQSAGESGILIEALPGLANIPAPEENGDTFEENAIFKALYYSSFTSGLVLADDSGLEVHELHGRPGVHSARYAGVAATDAENNKLLISNLAGMAQREARFVSVLALAKEGEILLIARGMVDGRLLTAPVGNDGFGYDPLFFYPPLERSFGQLTPEEKLAVSHRGCALRQLFKFLWEMLPA